MKNKSQVQSVRFSSEQMDKIRWLKEHKINPAKIIRMSFDISFEQYKKQYEDSKKFKYPF